MKKYNNYKGTQKWDKTKTDYAPTHSNFVDRTGDKIGRLILDYPIRLKNIVHWVCMCDCGNEVMVSISTLMRGDTNSCGCLRKDRLVIRNKNGWKGCGELSGSYIGQIKYNAKIRNIFYAVSTKYLWELFLSQNRKCVLSGFVLTFGDKRKKYREQTASLDRIDSDMGYVEGNVQWIHKVINIMKGKQDSENFIKICTAIANYNNTI